MGTDAPPVVVAEEIDEQDAARQQIRRAERAVGHLDGELGLAHSGQPRDHLPGGAGRRRVGPHRREQGLLLRLPAGEGGGGGRQAGQRGRDGGRELQGDVGVGTLHDGAEVHPAADGVVDAVPVI